MADPVSGKTLLQTLQPLVDSLQPAIDSVRTGLGIESESLPLEQTSRVAVDSVDRGIFGVIESLQNSHYQRHASILSKSHELANTAQTLNDDVEKVIGSLLLNSTFISLHLYLKNDEWPSLGAVRAEMSMQVFRNMINDRTIQDMLTKEKFKE